MHEATDISTRDHDAVVVGAGFGGLRMLHELRSKGLSVLVVDEATGVGGTWFWNRYPGCRTDTEAWYYCYSFDPEITREWTWSERFPARGEVEAYLNFVADRLDLRRDIRFGTRIDSAVWDDEAGVWRLTTDAGDVLTATYYVAAQGLLSASYMPDVPGLDDYEGELLFAPRWPADRGVDFAGKRVGVIGTGATGVQVIPAVARSAEQVVVFQRTPNFVIPSRNHALDEAQQLELRRDAEAMWKRTEKHPMGLPYPPGAGRVATELNDDEIDVALEEAWERGTFRFLFELFDDLMIEPATNKRVADFIRSKIRTLVHDPHKASLLSPSDHSVGSKRPPLGQHYYETFNRDNVQLVSVKETPISRVTPRGLVVGDQEWELDVLIFATGFDAVTGAFTNVDIRGRGGHTLKERWAQGPRTLHSLTVDDFPNFFMILGPQGPFAILTVVIEHEVQFISRAITHARESGTDFIEVRSDAVQEWVDEVDEAVRPSLEVRGTQSWLFGANIPGKARVVQQYFGGMDRWLTTIRTEADQGFPRYRSSTDAG